MLNISRSCFLCKSKKEILEILEIKGMEDSVFICQKCKSLKIFEGLYDYEIVKCVNVGFEIAKLNKIYLFYAINVALNRYSLQEAKRRNKLRQMELNGIKMDIFDMAKRTQGNFKILNQNNDN